MLLFCELHRVLVSCLLGFLLSLAVIGQSTTPSPKPAAPAGKKDELSPAGKELERWFEFEQLTFGARYNFAENANKRKTANNLQYQFISKFRVKFDPKAKYSLAANIGTGTSFTSYWNATGKGTGRLQKNLAFRQLYFDAKPTKAVEIQAGGLYINYGEMSEALTYDNDSFILGERVQIRAPKKLYFDEISLTSASIRDITTPNVFKRLKHFDNQNYHQFLVRKQFTKVVGFSADYTFQSGIDTLHQAVRLKLPPKHWIDTLLLEQYERVDPDKDYGFDVFAERKLNKMFTVGGGFERSKILLQLNGDRFPPGKRVYFVSQMKLSPEFTFAVNATEGVGYIAPNVHKTRVTVALTYNILESLKRSKLF